jgi:hypothetical protein
MPMIALVLALLFSAAAQAADLGALIFCDYTHEAPASGEHAGRFQTARAYLTLTGRPAETLGYRLQLDVGALKTYTLAAEDAGAVIDADGDTLGLRTYSLSGRDGAYFAYLKSAHVVWTTAAGRWTFGLQPLNMFNVPENTFGHRFLSKALMDEYKWSSSADMGVGYARKLGDRFSTSLLWTNGAGYKSPETDKYKKLSLQVVAGEIALNKRDGWNAGFVYSHEPTTSEHSRSVLGLFGGWAGHGLRVGAEIDTRITRSATDLTERIAGAYGTWNLPLSTPLELVAQLGLVDPDIDRDKDSWSDLLLGLAWKPVQGLIIGPNLRRLYYEAPGRGADSWYRVNFEFRM